MPKRVLIVDDERNITDLLSVILSREGYAVEVAFDGVEALKMVQQSPPDLVVLDIQMPKLDGWG